ncbi:MAG: uracil phosphoribosyltransferase [Polyangiaceae bacterium]|nr:uracil phosphoribosyltransferase [Polyangiaceae bacterium]
MVFDNVFVIDHPLVCHKLAILRMKDTSTSRFRALLREMSMLMAYELTRDLRTTEVALETPLAPAKGRMLEGKKVVLVSVLRAGNGMLDGVLELIPSARVGHIGLYRDPKTLEPVEYYFKMPGEMRDRDVLVMDPMLATGNSAAAAVTRVKQTRPRSIKYMCLLAAPEGIRAFHAEHPEVPIYTPAIDERLNDHGYIVPGLGDAGDRIYGTK